MRITRQSILSVCAALLAGSALLTSAWAADNGNGKDHSQDQQVDTIPPGAAGVLQHTDI